MRLLRIYLRDFRNYAEAKLDLCPDLNLIYGANGQGKSNLLEALYFLAVGRSFRGAKGNDMIRYDAPAFTIDALFEKGGVSQRLQITYGGGERTLLHNETKLPSFLPLLGLITAVIFSPGDHQLVCGPPAQRRRFLDLHLSQTDPLYVYHLSRYSRALKQRGRLLAAKRSEAIESWEMEMARSASYLVEQRERCLNELQGWASEMQQRISGGQEELTLIYKPASPQEIEEIAAAYRRSRSREMMLGHSIVGPHRDEFHLLLGGREARHFASEGQRCCSATALRMAEWHRLRAETGEKPLMLLDDATAPLDRERKGRFHQLLDEMGQLFFASPEPIPSPNRPAERYQIHSNEISHTSEYVAQHL